MTVLRHRQLLLLIAVYLTSTKDLEKTTSDLICLTPHPQLTIFFSVLAAQVPVVRG